LNRRIKLQVFFSPAFIEVKALEISRLKPSGQLAGQEHDSQGHCQVKKRVTVGCLKENDFGCIILK
jgi:hypothetical protein